MPDCMAAVDWGTAPWRHQCVPERRRELGKGRADKGAAHGVEMCAYLRIDLVLRVRGLGGGVYSGTQGERGALVRRDGKKTCMDGRACNTGGMLLAFHAHYILVKQILVLYRTEDVAGSI